MFLGSVATPGKRSQQKITVLVKPSPQRCALFFHLRELATRRTCAGNGSSTLRLNGRSRHLRGEQRGERRSRWTANGFWVAAKAPCRTWRHWWLETVVNPVFGKKGEGLSVSVAPEVQQNREHGRSWGVVCYMTFGMSLRKMGHQSLQKQIGFKSVSRIGGTLQNNKCSCRVHFPDACLANLENDKTLMSTPEKHTSVNNLPRNLLWLLGRVTPHLCFSAKQLYSKTWDPRRHITRKRWSFHHTGWASIFKKLSPQDVPISCKKNRCLSRRFWSRLMHRCAGTHQQALQLRLEIGINF